MSGEILIKSELDKPPSLEPEVKTDEEIVTKARDAGWRPKEEYDGDPASWVDADEFIKRAPLYDRIKTQSKKIKDLEKTVGSFHDHLTKAQQAAYQRAYRELEEKRQESILVGDAKAVKDLESKMEELNQSVEDLPPTQNKNKPPDEAVEWGKRNDWFFKDKELAAFAMSHHERYMATNPDAELSEALKITEAATKRAFPEKFENSRKSSVPAVEGGGERVGRKSHSYSDLNVAQKKICDRLVRQGVLTREDYIKDLEEIGDLR